MLKNGWVTSEKKGNECNYKEKDGRLKEQFINGINDDDEITDIMRELTTIKKANESTSEQVLPWAGRVEVQRAQKTI